MAEVRPVHVFRALSLFEARLPARAVQALAAEKLGADLAEALRVRDTKRLKDAGLMPEYIACFYRAVPTKEAADKLGAATHLAAMGVPKKLLSRVVDELGVDAARRLRENVYAGIRGAGGTLGEADAVAMGGGGALGRDSPGRVLGHATWLFAARARQGHTAAPRRLLASKLRFSMELSEAAVDRALTALVAAGTLASFTCAGVDTLAPADAYGAEETLATEIRRRAGAGRALDVVIDETDLTPEQLAAAHIVKTSSLSIVTGGPGTGKTTLLRRLTEALGTGRCMVMAPTGKAARNSNGKTVQYHATVAATSRRPIQETAPGDVPTGLDLVVVDEASMLTVDLLATVFKLVPRDCHIVLVGDAAQLPPVGAGNVLRDILGAGACPVSRLATNHRCSSAIAEFAAGVLGGGPGVVPDGVDIVCAENDVDTLDKLVAVAARGDGAQILVPQNDLRKLANRAMQLVKRGPLPVVSTQYFLLPKGDKGELTAEFDEAQGAYSCYLRPGPGNRMDLDTALRTTALDPGDLAHAMSEDDQPLLVGDRVLATKNLPNGVCNGDIGVVRTVLGADVSVDFGDDGRKNVPARNLALAYATTVHKFQGSETPSVVLPLTRHGTWDRELLYTAATRAQEKLVLVGTAEHIELIAHRARHERCTCLASLLV